MSAGVHVDDAVHRELVVDLDVLEADARDFQLAQLGGELLHRGERGVAVAGVRGGLAEVAGVEVRGARGVPHALAGAGGVPEGRVVGFVLVRGLELLGGQLEIPGAERALRRCELTGGGLAIFHRVVRCRRAAGGQAAGEGHHDQERGSLDAQHV